MDAARVLRRRAVVDPLTLDVQLAAPLAVVVAVEAEVQPGTEVEPGVGDDLHLERAVEPSAIVQWTRPPRSRRFTGSYASSGTMSVIRSTRPSGCSIVPQVALWSRPGPRKWFIAMNTP